MIGDIRYGFPEDCRLSYLLVTRRRVHVRVRWVEQIHTSTLAPVWVDDGQVRTGLHRDTSGRV